MYSTTFTSLCPVPCRSCSSSSNGSSSAAEAVRVEVVVLVVEVVVLVVEITIIICCCCCCCRREVEDAICWWAGPCNSAILCVHLLIYFYWCIGWEAPSLQMANWFPWRVWPFIGLCSQGQHLQISLPVESSEVACCPEKGMGRSWEAGVKFRKVWRRHRICGIMRVQEGRASVCFWSVQVLRYWIKNRIIAGTKQAVKPDFLCPECDGSSRLIRDQWGL